MGTTQCTVTECQAPTSNGLYLCGNCQSALEAELTTCSELLPHLTYVAMGLARLKKPGAEGGLGTNTTSPGVNLNAVSLGSDIQRLLENTSEEWARETLAAITLSKATECALTAAKLVEVDHLAQYEERARVEAARAKLIGRVGPDTPLQMRALRKWLLIAHDLDINASTIRQWQHRYGGLQVGEPEGDPSYDPSAVLEVAKSSPLSRA